MRFINRKTLAIAGAAVALVALSSTGTAVAGSLIGSSDIQDDSIRSVDVKDGSLKRADLSNPVNRALARITKDGVEGPRVDRRPGHPGPGPGANAQVSTNRVHDSFLIPTSGHATQSARRNEGDIVTGGWTPPSTSNATTADPPEPARTDNSTVEAKRDGWIVQGYGGSLDSNVNIWALCVPTTSV